MPSDPYAVLLALLRAEAARSAKPRPHPEPLPEPEPLEDALPADKDRE
ncbi:hypothetical protein NGF19_20655 [Streptomyces sp. RY43-2]|uniref:Uncharacterized protein n=1 Tax=Streptomyces macrolidinus TaxID=2952607 RepID=A0ABT0ZHY8_9ACTN|nr:hypothetical protein [Streptomyces macrolidinus]MCN9243175.1 hypothetical protein [Streptomyces macrolidinus]